MSLNLPNWPPDWLEIGQSVADAIATGDWGAYRSKVCNDLQSRLCREFVVAHCRLTCSGTAAIELALRASRVGPGDEVIMAAYDYPGNFRSVELLGATPVLVDIAPESACIDASQIESAASDKVVAVIATHLYGQAADVHSLRQVCDDRGWLLIEDACQVPGMSIHGRPVGSFGDFAAISFGGSKPITAGTGGALLSNNQRIFARLPSIVDRPSDTFPLSPLQAATIAPQLDRLCQLNQRRSAAASFLINQLPDFDWIDNNSPNITPAYYKLAWRSTKPVGPGHLPIGTGFRTTAQTSDRRCRKPVPLNRSIELSETCHVIDHRALLVEPEKYPELAAALGQLA